MRTDRGDQRVEVAESVTPERLVSGPELIPDSPIRQVARHGGITVDRSRWPTTFVNQSSSLREATANSSQSSPGRMIASCHIVQWQSSGLVQPADVIKGAMDARSQSSNTCWAVASDTARTHH